MNYELRVRSYELRVAIYEVRSGFKTWGGKVAVNKRVRF